MALNFCMLGMPSCPVYLALVIAFVNHRQAFYQLRHTPQPGGGGSHNNAVMGMPRRKELGRGTGTILSSQYIVSPMQRSGKLLWGGWVEMGLAYAAGWTGSSQGKESHLRTPAVSLTKERSRRELSC